MADIDILDEFRQPYNYMLHSKEENIDEEYRYRLLSNIFVDKSYRPKDDIKFLYLFGIFPCDNMPASYIPFNYKNLSQNFNRISKNNKFKNEEYKEVFTEAETNDNYKKDLSEKLDKLIKAFKSKHSLYNNLHTMPFIKILIILWTIVILGFMYILYYYYYSVFNYILAFVLFVLLLFAIIFKMFYIVHNS